MTTLEAAKRKAKYGHRDWLVWQTRAGEWDSARADLESIRTMANAVHLGSKAFLMHANCATLAKVSPKISRIMLTNAKSGHLYQE